MRDKIGSTLDAVAGMEYASKRFWEAAQACSANRQIEKAADYQARSYILARRAEGIRNYIRTLEIEIPDDIWKGPGDEIMKY